MISRCEINLASEYTSFAPRSGAEEGSSARQGATIVLLEKTKERERGRTAVSVAQSIKSRKERLMMITIVSIILRTISVESSKSLFEYELAIFG